MSIQTYICRTCNLDLGIGGALVESHLSSNPTHSIEQVIFDATGSTSTIEGPTRVYNNMLFSYDASRSKWLSNGRFTIDWGTPATGVKNVYMRLWGLMTPTSSAMGFLLPYNATITKLVANSSATSNQAATYRVRVYGAADIATIVLSAAELVGQDLTANADVAANTVLSSYLSSVGSGRSNPKLSIEIAWRI